MTDHTKPSKPKPPKGTAPKGGTRYPRYGLKESVEWARKLVARTHNGPQHADVIYASVVDSKGPRGEIKASTLKQFNLMEGPKEAYVATALAKSISAAPIEEAGPLLMEAALAPSLFKALFDTFHGDAFPLSKIRQRAAELNVHPENLDSAVSLYAATLNFAGLATVEGDKVVHKAIKNSTISTDEHNDDVSSDDPSGDNGEGKTDPREDGGENGTPRAIFHVNVSLDASLDSDKLEKQLALLKRYGAI
jgi:hypothetical protein